VARYPTGSSYSFGPGGMTPAVKILIITNVVLFLLNLIVGDVMTLRLGVSPQALNATLFYEDKTIRARVTVAQRKGYSTTYPIAAGSCGPGLTTAGAGTTESVGCDSPLINDFVFSKGTTNVDASLNINLTRNVSITFEGLNLTNQLTNRYAYDGQEATTLYGSSGRVYRAGARVTF